MYTNIKELKKKSWGLGRDRSVVKVTSCSSGDPNLILNTQVRQFNTACNSRPKGIYSCLLASVSTHMPVHKQPLTHININKHTNKYFLKNQVKLKPKLDKQTNQSQ